MAHYVEEEEGLQEGLEGQQTGGSDLERWLKQNNLDALVNAFKADDLSLEDLVDLHKSEQLDPYCHELNIKRTHKMLLIAKLKKMDRSATEEKTSCAIANQNDVTNVPLCEPGTSSQKRRIGIIAQIDKDHETGLIASVPGNDDHDTKQDTIPFRVRDCYGFDCRFVAIGTRIQYEAKHEESAYRAVNICLDLLPYQWFTQSAKPGVWKPQGMDKSREFEAIQNRKNALKSIAPGQMRITRFYGKVIELRPKCGLLEGFGIWFDIKECTFDPKYLQKGDRISYELKKQRNPTPSWKVAKVRFANLIPFYWQLILPGKEKYSTVPFRQNFNLEKKFNPLNHRYLSVKKVFADPDSGKRYKRCTTFKGKMREMPTESKKGKMTISYGNGFIGTLFVDVDPLRLQDIQLMRKVMYDFEIIHNGLGGFQVANVKKSIELVANPRKLAPQQQKPAPSQPKPASSHRRNPASSRPKPASSRPKPASSRPKPASSRQKLRYTVDEVVDITDTHAVIMSKRKRRITFNLADCHIPKEDIQIGCKVRYTALGSTAVHVSFAILNYKWKEYNQHAKTWTICSDKQSMSHEDKYNKNHEKMRSEIVLGGGKRLVRFSRFKGTVIRLNKVKNKTIGYVKHDECYTVPFEPDECDFNINLLNEGDPLSYEIERQQDAEGVIKFKCIGVKFAPLQRILDRTYSSKLEEVDAVTRIAKLSIPSRLLDVYKNRFESKDNETTEIGGSRFFGFLFGVGRVAKSMMSGSPTSPRSKYICFALSECKGFNAAKLKKGCVLKYKIKMNEKHVVEGDAFPFKAVEVRISPLSYQWEQLRNGQWMGLSREKSIEYEETHNIKKYKEMQGVVQTNDGTVIRRITSFKANVLTVNKANGSGQVSINYRSEYGDYIGIWFNFRDCRFNPKYLKPGDAVEYKLRGNRAVNVLLWLIPYKWEYKDNDAYGWETFSYHECIEIEKQKNPEGDDDCKEIEIRRNNATVTARRRIVFRTRAIVDQRNQTECHLAVTYGTDDLGIRLTYTLDPADGIQNDDWVDFEVKRDDEMRRWIAWNVKKVQFESQEKRSISLKQILSIMTLLCVVVSVVYALV